VGIFKAYQTKVGAGGMPTELNGELADTIRERGQEYGTTTGRPRRIGYFDGVAARYAHRINGFTDIAITKVDTLADMGELKVATGYTSAGKPSEFQTDNHLLKDCQAVYETYPGWSSQQIKDVTTYEGLPPALKNYSEAIMATMPGAKMSFIGVGRSRDQLIKL
jgi:adenylosuccinate synthase